MLIIIPRFSLWFSYPPLGALYIAAFLRKHGEKTDIIDANTIPESKFFSLLEKKATEHKFIGISANISHASSGLKIAKHLRDKFPSKKIVWGGPYPSIEYEKLIPQLADIVVVSEGEIQILDIVKGKSPEDIPGIAWHNGIELKINPRQGYIENLDDLPFPAWDMIDVRKYNFPGKMPGHMLITERGCPYNCINCSTFMQGRIYRTRSVENVVDEIEYLVKKLNSREIHIWDENFTLKTGRVKEICASIIERGLHKKVRFTLPNGIRADIIDEEMFDMMHRAGFYYASVAIESGDQEILDKIGKNLDLSKASQMLRILDRKGFRIGLSFMMGFPFDTIDSLKKTVELASRLPGDHAHFFIVTPLPGTELFSMIQKNYRMNMDFENKTVNYSSANFRFESSSITDSELNYYRKLAYRRFYLNPKRIFKTAVKFIKDGGFYYDTCFILKNAYNILFSGHR